MRCQYSWALPVSGQMTAFAIPGCRLRLTVSWSITAQSSKYWSMRDSGLLGVTVGLFIVYKWFSMRYHTLRTCAGVIPV